MIAPARNRWGAVLGVLGVFGLLAGAVTFGWSLRRERASTRGVDPVASDGDGTPYDELKEELGRLRREVRLQRSVATIAAATAARPVEASRANGSDSPARPRPSPPALSPEEQEHILAARFETFAGALASEPRDRAWAGEVEAKIAEALHAQPAKGTRLLAAACGSTLCRMEALAETEAGAVELIETFPTSLAANVSGALRKVPTADHKFRVVAFLAREGHALPAAEPPSGSDELSAAGRATAEASP